MTNVKNKTNVSVSVQKTTTIIMFHVIVFSRFLSCYSPDLVYFKVNSLMPLNFDAFLFESGVFRRRT